MTRLLVLLPLVALTACGSLRSVEQRTTQGPTALQLWYASVVAQNGREPTFEERRYWEDDLEARISAYLRDHPEAASSLNVSGFRYLKQVAVGMDREQVRILLGPPTRTLTERKEMEIAARKYWPLVRDVANEAWVYPFGWTLFFAGTRLADIVQYGPSTS